MSEHRAERDDLGDVVDGDVLAERDAPFRLPEWTSEPWQDEQGAWMVTRQSGCLTWFEPCEPPTRH